METPDASKATFRHLPASAMVRFVPYACNSVRVRDSCEQRKRDQNPGRPKQPKHDSSVRFRKCARAIMIRARCARH